MKNPDAMLLRERPSSANWAQGDFLTDCFHFQRIARFQPELFSQRLWNHDATSFIDGEMGSHDGIVRWVDPPIDTILIGGLPTSIPTAVYPSAEPTPMTVRHSDRAFLPQKTWPRIYLHGLWFGPQVTGGETVAVLSLHAPDVATISS